MFSIKSNIGDWMKAIGLVGVTLGIPLACAVAWVTHVIVCIKTTSFLFLLVGAVVVPVGVIHGIGVWFGAW